MNGSRYSDPAWRAVEQDRLLERGLRLLLWPAVWELSSSNGAHYGNGDSDGDGDGDGYDNGGYGCGYSDGGYGYGNGNGDGAEDGSGDAGFGGY